ncbi:MAG: hypothetical protein ACI8PQ_003319 [Planctomycetota bacterium]
MRVTPPGQLQPPGEDTLPTDDHELILIGGLHRSGTTLFASCVARHPSASGFSNTGTKRDEGQFLQPVYAPAREFGGPGRFGLDPRSHLDESSTLVTKENAQRIFSAWGEHWDLEKKVLVEKSPPNILKSRFLQALFPRSQQIMLLRHPIAACLATRKWVKGSSLGDLLEHWVRCHELLRSDSKRIDRLQIFSYESFVAHPDQAMERVYGSLGLEPHPAGLEVHGNINQKYFDVFARESKGLLTGRSTRRAVDELGERVHALGYSLVDLHVDNVASVWG